MRGLLFVFAALLVGDAIAANNVVIYRCTEADGALTIQNNVPCPKGTRQERRVIAPPPAAPAYVPVVPVRPVSRPTPAPAAAVAATTPATPVIADADRLPPPELFRCNTYDNDSYLSDIGTPAPRCVRLNTTGIDGSADMGAGAACQMVTDQCDRVADGAICASWTQRRKQVEAAWKFGSG
ncbi:MAG: DUF4124 domain-containing protein, partial [Lysobacter sp.]|nr:DUF4124 domain-containing protein [Lysobacter sp.]